MLLGLMCKYSCEDSTMILFDSSKSCYASVELASGTILENMARCNFESVSIKPPAWIVSKQMLVNDLMNISVRFKATLLSGQQF